MSKKKLAADSCFRMLLLASVSRPEKGLPARSRQKHVCVESTNERRWDGTGKIRLSCHTAAFHCRVLLQGKYDGGRSGAHPFRPVFARDCIAGNQGFFRVA